MDLELLERFGIAGLIGIFFFLVLKWVLEQFKTELIENRKERKEYLDALSGIKQELSDHNIRAREFQYCVQKEHNQMIQSLGRINGYKADGC
jgi:uncharacterized coiled-coil DUF342 family protein